MLPASAGAAWHALPWRLPVQMAFPERCLRQKRYGVFLLDLQRKYRTRRLVPLHARIAIYLRSTSCSRSLLYVLHGGA